VAPAPPFGVIAAVAPVPRPAAPRKTASGRLRDLLRAVCRLGQLLADAPAGAPGIPVPSSGPRGWTFRAVVPIKRRAKALGGAGDSGGAHICAALRHRAQDQLATGARASVPWPGWPLPVVVVTAVMVVVVAHSVPPSPAPAPWSGRGLPWRRRAQAEIAHREALCRREDVRPGSPSAQRPSDCAGRCLVAPLVISGSRWRRGCSPGRPVAADTTRARRAARPRVGSGSNHPAREPRSPALGLGH
jgi:hypothetical protein